MVGVGHWVAAEERLLAALEVEQLGAVAVHSLAGEEAAQWAREAARLLEEARVEEVHWVARERVGPVQLGLCC